MAAKKGSTSALEGPALVQAVMKTIAADPKSTFWPKKTQRKPKPLPAPRIAELELAGRALPPSMKTWLSLGSDLEGVDFATDEAWQVATLQEHAAQRFGDLAAHLVGLAGPKFEAPCLVLREEAGNKLEVLYLGAQDAGGEFPVLQAYLENPGYSRLALWHPGFDVFLASQVRADRAAAFGVPGGGECVEVDDPRWGRRMKAHMKALGLTKATIKLGR
ncbi:MAG: hypothetical protein JNL79_07420 [Myxococcales bacterium]|nr:hypothetical protein [Myxococcales bacterium]